MQNIEKLRAQGFVIQVAPDVAGCTEVLLDRPFYAYNPRFAQTPEEIYVKLQHANPAANGRYHMLLAGDDMLARGELSYSVLTQNEYAEVYEAYRRLTARKDALAVAQRAFDEERTTYAGVVNAITAR